MYISLYVYVLNKRNHVIVFQEYLFLFICRGQHEHSTIYCRIYTILISSHRGKRDTYNNQCPYLNNSTEKQVGRPYKTCF